MKGKKISSQIDEIGLSLSSSLRNIGKALKSRSKSTGKPAGLIMWVDVKKGDFTQKFTQDKDEAKKIFEETIKEKSWRKTKQKAFLIKTVIDALCQAFKRFKDDFFNS